VWVWVLHFITLMIECLWEHSMFIIILYFVSLIRKLKTFMIMNSYLFSWTIRGCALRLLRNSWIDKKEVVIMDVITSLLIVNADNPGRAIEAIKSLLVRPHPTWKSPRSPRDTKLCSFWEKDACCDGKLYVRYERVGSYLLTEVYRTFSSFFINLVVE
jgi:hypothetical protein